MPAPVVIHAASLDALDARGQRARAEGLLSPAEQARRTRFMFDENRREYAYAHALARLALTAQAPDVAPEAWTFAEEEGGRPFVAAPESRRGLRFNLSHTDGLVAVAVVADDVDVGVDVEAIDASRATVRVAERFFARDETAALVALPEAAQTRRFYEYWTLKEAYVKARGVGLATPLADFSVAPDRDPPSIAFASGRDERAADWQLFQRAIGEQHVLAACVARRGEARRFALVRVDDLDAVLSGGDRPR